MGWVLLSTLFLLGSSVMGWVLWRNENNKDSTAQVGAKKDLSNGMGAVDYPNPIGF
jgi:hypothetical protein